MAKTYAEMETWQQRVADERDEVIGWVGKTEKRANDLDKFIALADTWATLPAAEQERMTEQLRCMRNSVERLREYVSALVLRIGAF